jgi:hypothetical protein
MIVKFSILFVFFLITPLFANDNNNYLSFYCKFKCFQDTSGTGNFIWNGDYFIGNINIFSNSNAGKLEGSWEFVRITEWKNTNYFPSVAHSWDCGSNFKQIRNIKFNGDQISFDLYLDSACEDCVVLHFIGDSKNKNSFKGNGIMKSFVDNKMYKCEFRPLQEVHLQSQIIK